MSFKFFVLFFILILTASTVSADMPPIYHYDRHMKELKQALEDYDYESAAESIDQIDILCVEESFVPPGLYFYYKAEVFNNIGRYDDAETSLEKYYETSGSSGRFYEKSFVLYEMIQTGINKERELRDREQAEAKRKVREREREIKSISDSLVKFFIGDYINYDYVSQYSTSSDTTKTNFHRVFKFSEIYQCEFNLFQQIEIETTFTEINKKPFTYMETLTKYGSLSFHKGIRIELKRDGMNIYMKVFKSNGSLDDNNEIEKIRVNKKKIMNSVASKVGLNLYDQDDLFKANDLSEDEMEYIFNNIKDKFERLTDLCNE